MLINTDFFVGDYVYVDRVKRYGYIVWAEGDKYLVEFNDGRSVEVSEDEFIWMGDS